MKNLQNKIFEIFDFISISLISIKLYCADFDALFFNIALRFILVIQQFNNKQFLQNNQKKFKLQYKYLRQLNKINVILICFNFLPIIIILKKNRSKNHKTKFDEFNKFKKNFE